MGDLIETATDWYVVRRAIGEGGAGRVYAVLDSDGREVALKCLSPSAATSQKRKRFKNELFFGLRNKHRNVIEVIDFGIQREGGVSLPFYVMPLFGSTLAKLIGEGIPPDRVLAVFSQLLDGVEAAHLLGVIHRDLKPENVLYNASEDRVVIADFGIAHFEEDALITAVETRAQDRLANFAYSAPEQRVRGQSVDHRADIFSLGLVLNEMFTRSIPQGAGYRRIREVAPSLGYLDEIVEAMIQQSPGSRPSSIADVKKILIGRRNEFVALQELNEKRKEVVRAGTAPEVEKITVEGVDYRDGKVLLLLNQSPGHRWIGRFKDPRENFGSLFGIHPANFSFFADRVEHPARDEREAAAVPEHFARFAAMAERTLQQELEHEARAKEHQERQRLQREIAEEEKRVRILQAMKSAASSGRSPQDS